MNQADQKLRIDRWLFFARFYKTRTLAKAAVSGGHVRLNGIRATPGAQVKIGDNLVLVRDQLKFDLEVVAIPARRGPASEAQSCYVEDPDARLKREETQAALRSDRRTMPQTAGRPDKHTRRLLRDRNRDDS